MKYLSSLLERFSNILDRNVQIKESIISAIKNKTGITLSPSNIALKNGVLEIEASPIVKNEIRLREESIRSDLGKIHNIAITRVFYK